MRTSLLGYHGPDSRSLSFTPVPSLDDSTRSSGRIKTRKSNLSIDVQRAAKYPRTSASIPGTVTQLCHKAQTPISAFQRLTITSSPEKNNCTSSNAFNIFDAFMEHNELLLYLTTNILLPSDFLTLYSISKPFHLKVNAHQTAYILSAVRAWAPVGDPCPTANLTPKLPLHFLSAHRLDPSRPSEALTAPEIIPFTFYKEHCHMDPIIENKPRNVSLNLAQTLLRGEPGRAVPSFRYLFFITHEMAAARAIIRILWEAHGLCVPADTLRTMGKLALLMHARNNAARLSLVHNTVWFTAADLFRANTLFMKLDMAFTDPLRRAKPKIAKGDFASRGRLGLGRGMRQLLCAQRGWSVCARVLARHDGYKTRLDFFKLWAEWACVPRAARGRPRSYKVWGLRSDQLGRLGSEELRKWVRGERKLMPIEEYVVREGVRRDLDMHNWILEMMICGFVDPETLDIPLK